MSAALIAEAAQITEGVELPAPGRGEARIDQAGDTGVIEKAAQRKPGARTGGLAVQERAQPRAAGASLAEASEPRQGAPARAASAP